MEKSSIIDQVKDFIVYEKETVKKRLTEISKLDLADRQKFSHEEFMRISKEFLELLKRYDDEFIIYVKDKK